MRTIANNSTGLAEARRLMGEKGWSIATLCRRMREVDTAGTSILDVTVSLIMRGKNGAGLALGLLIAKALEFDANLWLEMYAGNAIGEFKLPKIQIPGPGRGHTGSMIQIEDRAHASGKLRGCPPQSDNVKQASKRLAATRKRHAAVADATGDGKSAGGEEQEKERRKKSKRVQQNRGDMRPSRRRPRSD